MAPTTAVPSKNCASCGRTMTWRRSWAKNWDEVRYCSDACRRRKVSTVDRTLEAEILAALHQRARAASICPSEVARRVGDDTTWRTLMEPTRAAARRLANAGLVEVTQSGRSVDPSTARGPIRIRLVDGPPSCDGQVAGPPES